MPPTDSKLITIPPSSAGSLTGNSHLRGQTGWRAIDGFRREKH